MQTCRHRQRPERRVIAATVRRAAPSLSASRTAFVISSTNKGMPSVRSTISASTSAGSRKGTGQARDNGSRFSFPKPVQHVRENRHMRLSHPRRFELGAGSYDEHRRRIFNPIYGPASTFQARGVGPMGILEDPAPLVSGVPMPQLLGQSFQRSLPALFRSRVRARDSVRRLATTAQSRRRVRRLDGGRGLRQHGIELVEFCLRCVIVRLW